MDSRFAARFPRQLVLWTIHGCIIAAPSVAFVILALGSNLDAPTLWAVAAAITCLALICATLAALSDSLNTPGHAVARTMKITLWIRAILTAASLPCILSQDISLALRAPDVLCGLVIMWGYNLMTRHLPLPDPMHFLAGKNFTLYFCMSLIQGLALLGMTAVIGFLVLLVVQFKDHRKGRFAAGFTNPPPRPDA